jgi:hypothetical protein
MFGVFKNKIMTSLVALTSLMFTSYKGNDVKIVNPEVLLNSNKLTVNTYLQDAFVNDFDQLFKSGKELKIYYNVELHVNNELELNKTFIHSVLFDPMDQTYDVFMEETASYVTCTTVEQLIPHLSDFNFSHYFDDGLPQRSKINVKITVFLDKIKLTREKEFDLMMLWKFKRPQTQSQIFY